MTKKQIARLNEIARQQGYYLSEGAYSGTSDDVAGTWYLVPIEGTVLDRRGVGYRTEEEILEQLEEMRYWVRMNEMYR